MRWQLAGIEGQPEVTKGVQSSLMTPTAQQIMVRPLQRLPGWTAGLVAVALLLAGVLPVLQAGHLEALPAQSIGMLAERLAKAQPALAQVEPAGPQSVAAQAPGPGFGARNEYNFGLASKPLAASTGTVEIGRAHV